MEDEMEDIFGSLTLILTLCMNFIAWPSQILKNYREKKCGLTFFITLIPILLVLTRITYASLIKAWYVAIPDCIGIFFLITVFIQYFYYKDYHKNQRAQ